jgi:hypothetical protein
VAYTPADLVCGPFAAKTVWTQKKAFRFVRWWKATHPCVDCSDKQGQPVFYQPWQMEFDHQPGTKWITIGHSHQLRVLSEEEIRMEISKCDLVCANCHREREHTRRVMRRLMKKSE